MKRDQVDVIIIWGFMILAYGMGWLHAGSVLR